MPASLINGKIVAAARRNQLKQEIHLATQLGIRAPSLAVILIGNDPASNIYVTNKRKACAEVGISSYSYDLPETTSEDELLELVTQLNESDEVDGILIQLPLPSHINTQAVIEHIKPTKDVDGFHPYNLGKLAQRHPVLRSCTPCGIMSLLEYYHLDVKGKHAVVVGASNIVGRPMSLELLKAGATVTICHRQTQNVQQLVEIADIIVVAAGQQDVIPAHWFQKKHIVIDVGIHRLADGSIRGDIDFDLVKEKVSWITPVPGGVGPMTIVALLENTLLAAELNRC